MDQLPGRLAATWNSLSPGRRALLTASAVALVGLSLLLYTWSSSTQFLTLYSGLDSADSGRIVEQLRSQGVAFRLEAGGATVLVPESSLDELRVDFAAQGLPQGGHVGFELFDTSAFTATDFVQRLNFQRGLQGELERTIESFPVVDRARVHIVLPERSLFVVDERPATASILLQMRPGRALAADEVAGIAHLVSGAVESLEKSSITIVSTSGSVLYDGPAAAAGGGLAAGNTQLAVQRAFEEGIEGDVQQLLDRTLGAGRSAVQVRAVLNFDRLETETETFTPGAGGAAVQRSTSTVTETYSAGGDGAVPASVPGVATNVPNAGSGATVPLEEEISNYARSETASNFEVGRTVTRSVRAVGQVERLSVSLLLDESVDESLVVSLTAAVSAAAGLDTSRGDTIAVSRLPFDRTAIDAAAAAFAAEASSAQIMGYVRMGLPVLLLLVAVVFFRLLMRSVSKQAAGYRSVEATEGGAQLMISQGVPAAAALPAGVAGALPAAAEPVDMRSPVEQSVTTMATTNPASVTNVVQSWLREG